MPGLVAEHLEFVCCSSLVKRLPKDAHHGEKLHDVMLSQKRGWIQKRMMLTDLLV